MSPTPRLRRPLRSALLWLGAASFATCGGEQPPGATTDVPPEAALEVATRLEVRNARMPTPGLITSGQPSEEQLDALAEAGVRRFISLRPTSEDGAGWEEAYTMPAGVEFERLPISGAASLTRENVETFAALMEEAGDESTSIYCASSNRVGAMLALKAFWIDGVEAGEALAIGESAGLTRLADPVRELMGLEPSN